MTLFDVNGRLLATTVGRAVFTKKEAVMVYTIKPRKDQPIDFKAILPRPPSSLLSTIHHIYDFELSTEPYTRQLNSMWGGISWIAQRSPVAS